MARLGFGVVGVKGMGRGHCRAIAQTNSAQTVAVMDIDPQVARRVGEEFGVASYVDYGDLLADARVDVVDICTPHTCHPEQAIQAMRAGKMVLVEKPMAVTVAEADRMVRASASAGQPLGVVFQFRTRAINRRFREVVAESGDLYRTLMAVSGVRTQAYYRSDPWRGSWTHEGGGLLVNQAPHWLDLFQWFFGMPTRVLAWTRTRAHAITVEDQAFAHVEYPSGTVGTWVSNTTDVPGCHHVEAFGTKAAVRSSENRLERAVVEPPLDVFLATSTEMWGRPKTAWEAIEVADAGGSHAQVIEEFCQAVMKGQAPPVDAVEGRKQVELSCAIALSSALGKAVKVPVGRKAYDDLLAGRRRAETRRAGRSRQRRTRPA